MPDVSEITLDAIILEWHMGDENVARKMFADVIDTARREGLEQAAVIAEDSCSLGLDSFEVRENIAQEIRSRSHDRH
jgi:hypothetical protein